MSLYKQCRMTPAAASAKARLFFLVCLLILTSICLTGGACAETGDGVRTVVTSDALLADMARALLPAGRYRVEPIFPPGHCPGHYDVKLSDIEKIQKARLVIFSRSVTFMGKPGHGRLLLDSEGRNWMAPDSYIFGIECLAEKLVEHFPEDETEIQARKKTVTHLVRQEAQKLKERLRRAGLDNLPVLASSMQMEPLTWMGFQIAGVYGRPEALTAKEVSRLLKTGREKKVVAVVDNLQSGPDAGRGIAEALGKPHIVLTNYPSEEGYPAALRDNVEVILAALERK